MPTPRVQARARTMAEITRIGREHLEAYGPAGLSLRAVARDLGVVSSAVYRYVPSRDELLTLLVVDAYTELGQVVTHAEAQLPRPDHRGRWCALAGAVRDWAVAEPSRYGLVFGTPVAGYHAPAERTVDPGTIVPVLILKLAADAQAAGRLPTGPAGGVPESMERDARRIAAGYGLDLSPAMMTAAVLAWFSLFGAVSFEVFGQYGKDAFSQPAATFAALMDVLAGVLGLTDA